MTDTEQLIRQAAHELQITVTKITVTAAEPDLTAMEVINTYTVSFSSNAGDPVTADITTGSGYPAIYSILKAARKGNARAQMRITD
jgi:hypothetical protein